MNKTLISIEELKQSKSLSVKSTLTLDARTYPPSAFIPSQMRWSKAIGLHKFRHEYNLLTG